MLPTYICSCLHVYVYMRHRPNAAARQRTDEPYFDYRDAIGYIDEYDIDFESENIKDKIKEYSSNNFLDSKSLME